MHTIIPDIHADLSRLDASISAANGSPIAFLGDFIDAGPAPSFTPNDRIVLERVKALMEAGRAIAVMGNHELNAILFHTTGTDGQPLRAHNAKNQTQHSSFIEAFGIGTPEARDWTDWFLSALPLWHDHAEFRLIHACWSKDALSVVRARRPDGFLKPEDLPEIADESTSFGRAVKLLVSGAEADLPAGFSFRDKSGHERHSVRLSWWRAGNSWRDAALSVPDRNQLPETPLPSGLSVTPYPQNASPVFVGHYKMDGLPRLEADKVVCLDYPATPCIYVWQGEATLTSAHLLCLGPK